VVKPTSGQIQIEILKILKDGNIHTKNEVVEKTAKYFKINIKSTNSRIDPFAKDVVRQISVVRKNEWLKNPPQKEKFAITNTGKGIIDLMVL